MKMKNLAALLMAASILASSGLPASAAVVRRKTSTASTKTVEADYTLRLDDDGFEFLKDGKSQGNWQCETGRYTLARSNEAGSVAIQFTNKNGSLRKVTLGTYGTVLIEGDVDYLFLSSTLGANVPVIIGSGAEVDDLTVSSEGKVTINGKVDQLDVQDADATITVSGTGASVRRADVVNGTTVKGLDSSRIHTSGTRVITSSKKDSDSSGRHLTVKYNAATGKWEERWGDDDDDDGISYRYGSKLGIDDVKLRAESVSFECEVSGASVYVDGHYLGKTSKGDNDFYFTNDDNDSYTLRIEKSGYDDYRDRYSSGTRYGRD